MITRKYDNYTTVLYEREDLEKLPTRVLIRMIHCSADSNRLYNKAGNEVEFMWDVGWSYVYEEDVLRDILSKRPHIPNKQERRKLINSMKKKSKKRLEFRR